MKKYTKIAAVALAASALIACNKEIQAPEQISPKDVVTVTLGVDTKAVMGDVEGMKWEVGDVIQWRGTTGNVKHTLAAEDIREDGYKAVFSTEIPNIAAENVKGVFRYNMHPDNDVEFEYTLAPKNGDAAALSGETLTLVQPCAGQMNKTAIFLHSGTDNCVTIAKGSTELVSKMDIAGSIVRLLPYTTEFNNEKVKSVSLSSNSFFAGTVSYNYAEGTFRGTNDVNWKKIKKYTVEVTELMDLSDATSREKSSGFYMGLPATTGEANVINGYKVVVRTDKATYTYETDSKLVLSENKVKNIYLNLDASHRVGDDDVKGSLHYTGGLADNQSHTFTAEGGEHAYSYWCAQVKKTGEDNWSTVEANPSVENGDPDFYSSAEFSIIDDATGKPADWCTAYYRANDTWILVKVQPNDNSADRSATITITYKSVKGYIIEDASKTKVIKAVQLGKTNIVPSISFDGSTDIPSEAGQYTATISLNVNGAAVTADRFETYASLLTITSANCSVKRSGEVLTINVAANPTTEAREVKVEVSATGGNSALVLTQAASAVAVTLRFNYNFGDWQKGLGGKFARSYSKKGNTGEWVAVFYDLTIDGQKPSSALNEEDTKALVMQMLKMTGEEYDNSFIKFRVDGYNGEVKLLADCQPNYTSEARSISGYVWLADQSAYINSFTFNQEPGPDFKSFSVSPASVTVAADAISAAFTITAADDVEWTIGTPDGVSVNKSSGTGNSAITASFAANTGSDAKQYTLTVSTASGGVENSSLTVTIRQAAPGGAAGKSYEYDFVKNNGNGTGAVFGLPANHNPGVDFQIKNVKVNGADFDYSDETAVAELLEYVFDIREPEAGEMATGYDGYKFAKGQLYPKKIYANMVNGVGVGIASGETGYRARFAWKDASGTELGYYFVFVP